MGRKRNSGAGATNVDTTEEDGGTTTEEEDVSEKVILEISVTDTGIGMPADRLPRLFKSFSQIDISTARRYGGTGLGLAISSMLVNRMGGGLWVESEEGLGSRFALTLPLSIAYGRPDINALGSHIGSESSSTYTSSGMVASPPSPGSSVSDGGSSIGERSDHASFATPSSPSNLTSYFPAQITNTTNSRPLKYPTSGVSTTSLPWEPINIPSTPSPAPTTFEPNYININNNNASNATNNKELQNLITKSKTSNDKLDSDFNTAAAFDLPTVKSKPRVTLAKQYHHRKSNANNNEENLALLYPIKIMLAEDNVCKFFIYIIICLLIHIIQ